MIIDKCDMHGLATSLLDFTDYDTNTIVNQYCTYRTDINIIPEILMGDGRSENSKGNGRFQKRLECNFDEKRLLGGCA